MESIQTDNERSADTQSDGVPEEKTKAPSAFADEASEAAARVPEEKETSDDASKAISAELAKINALDPSIRSFDDIFNSDTGAIFTEKVKRGYSLYDAFLISNKKRILKSITEAAHQSALNSLSSKSHLTGAGISKAEAPVDVPSKTYSLYKAMFPELTDSQIRSHYAKHNRKK